MAAPRMYWLAPALVVALGGPVAVGDRDAPDPSTGTDETLVPSGGLEIEAAEPIPRENGVALDQTYPALTDWTHPVADSDEVVPLRPQRKFGAERDTHNRGCGDGHCGVDLAGPRGRTVMAVVDGKVLHVEHRRRGKDGHSGRYVKIEHAGGILTAYMHLDSIAPGLAEGDEVHAGQFIGRLGKTGIRHGDPHLHFSLELPLENPTKKVKTRFIDPTPFLQRSRVVGDPARREIEERRRNKS